MSFPVAEFVDAVRQHRFLFDRNEPEFKNVAKKEAMWEAIGQQFGISGCKAMNKFRNMRDKYFKVRKQEMMERRICTPRFRKPVKTWAFYHMMRQVLERKHHTPAGAAQGTEGSEDAGKSNENAMAELGIDPSWVTAANGVEVYDPELASVNLETTLRLENGTMVSIKQEPPEEMETTVSEHEASMVSGDEEEPAVDSEHEDEATLASLERSITWARALFYKRRKEFKGAVDSLERGRPVTSPSTPAEASRPELCLISETGPCYDAQTQTSMPPSQEPQQAGASGVAEPVPSHSPAPTTSPTLCAVPAATEDGLEHFGLFVAQRLRMADSVVQARVMSAILKLVVDIPSAS
uniref:Putative alcohol dehydrogenase transcription factor myb/sant-like protein n=1 Tax=Amblyomma sculptum TaxID=1581419 RepID=A0A1E1XNB8_AMBSC